MPSAGVVPFLQTFVCNLDNKCHSQESRQNALQTASSVSSLVQQITPYLGDEGTLKMLDNVEDGVTLINSFNNLVQDNTLMDKLDNATHLAQYFREPDKLKAVLVDDYNFTQQAADALMESQANLTSVMALSGYPDLKGVACHPQRLKDFLIFPEGTNVTEVSRTLCDINESRIPEITRFLQNQIDVAEIVRLLGLFETLKTRLDISDYTVVDGFRDVADMLDLLLSIQDLTDMVRELAAIKGLPDVIRNLPQWFNQLMESGDAVAPLEGLIRSMDPIVNQFFPNDTTWSTLRDGLQLGSYITDIISGNVTNAGFIQLAGTVMKDIEKIFNDLSPEVKGTLDVLSTVNWNQIVPLLFNGGEFNETILTQGLGQLQEALEQTPLWTEMARYLSLYTDVMQSVNLVLHELTEAHENVAELSSGEGELRQMMDMLLEKGPNVTLAVLKAFTHSDTLAVLLADGPRFSDVCSDVIAAVRDHIGGTTAEELNVTLCFGDLQHAVDSLLNELDVNNISIAINKTIARLVTVFTNNATYVTEESVSLVRVLHEAQLFMTNLEKLMNVTATSWADLFSMGGTLSQLMEDHSRDWEPVLDLLDENYLGSSVLSLLTAAGKLMNDSNSAQWMEANLGPYVHTAALMMKSLYTEMELMMNMYSRSSPLGQLVYFGTNYAPDIMTAVLDMGTNVRVDMIYRVVSSPDPLSTFCTEHMLHQMGLPDDVSMKMEDVVCLTNWTQMGEQLMSTQTTFTTMIQEMTESMTGVGSASYSLESDWREVNYYTSRVMDMVMSQDSAQVSMVVTGGPWTLVNYANFSQVMVAMGTVMDRIQTMNIDDLNILINIVGLVMENIEEMVEREANVTSTVLEWRRVKHYFKMMEDINVIVMEISNQNTTMSLSAAFNSYPSELQYMLNLAADAYLEFIDALKFIILKPDQLIHKLVSEGLQVPNCGQVTVTNYLTLAADSSFGQLETEVCTANWTALSQQMTSSPQLQAVDDAVNDLVKQMSDLDRLELDPAVNFTHVLHQTVQAVDAALAALGQLEQVTSTFDLLPFNMTAIDAKWAQFYKDLDQLENLDVLSLSAAAQELQTLMEDELFKAMPNNTALIQMLNANLYLPVPLLEFVNIQLDYFNSTSEVNLFGMLGSDEVRKVAQVLRYSPQINEIGVNTLIRIISDPSQMAVVDPSLLCSNLTLFSAVFALDDEVMDRQLLQQTVCSLDVNFTLLLEELQDNWAGFAELIQALNQIVESKVPLRVNVTQLSVIQAKYTQLLQAVIISPPAFTLFDDDGWMNATLYEGPWMKLWDELQKAYENYQDPSNLQGLLTPLLSSLASDPSMQSTLVYLDAILDMIHRYSSSMDSIPESFASYPNLDKMYSLVEQLPELTEMLVYTAMQRPEQLNNWGSAMVSWETFCNADPMTLMTAPPGGGLNVVSVFDRLCSINFAQLMTELNAYQGLDRLNALLATNDTTTESVNMTALAEKMNAVLGQLGSVNTTSLTMNFDLRFLNTSVWNAVFERLGQDWNQTLEKAMTPDYLLQMFNRTLFTLPEFGGLQGTAEQVLAMMDIVLDQVLQSLQGGSLQEMFSQYPTVKSAVTLMDHLPGIFDTLAYTAINTPQKLMERSEALMSLETFCGADIHLLVTAPPGSGYDPAVWQQMLCSINVTVMLEELAEYQGTNEIANIFMPNSSFSLNLTSSSEKMSKVTLEFGRLFSSNSTSFNMNTFINLTAWEGVSRHLQDWLEEAYIEQWSNISSYKSLLSASVLSGLQAIPEVNTALGYLSAILDMFQQQFENSIKSLPDAFGAYPNMNILLSLLEDVPEIFEMFAYTTLQRQNQLARWSPAMASWDVFCSSEPTSLLSAPPGSRLTVQDVFLRLCSLNVTELMTELNQYQGMDQLQALMWSNTTEAVNVTAMAERLSSLIDSMQTLYSSPMQSGYNLRLFNQTVWEQVFERLGKDLNGTQQQFMSPEVLMDFYQKLFAGYSELNDTGDTMNKVWAMTDIIVDQMLRSLQGGSLEEMFDQYPTIKSAVSLLDNLPEIYETVMYTALYAPDKVVLRAESFGSLETLCTTDMNTIFTVPDGVDFDLAAWQTGFCSLNLTVLMEELAQYRGTQDIANIFSPNSTVTVNMTSVIHKMESVLSQLTHMNNGSTTMLNFNARFLDLSLWQVANSNLAKWASNSTALFWMRGDAMIELFGEVNQQYPNLTMDLDFVRPVYSVLSLLTEKLIPYENMSSFTLEELFVGAPEIQKFIQLLQEPGVIEVLFESANSRQFEPLLSTNNLTATFVMLCTPLASLDQYLTVPDRLDIDLTLLKTRLCGLDLQSLQQEVMDFFEVDRLMAALNGSLPVDYTALSHQYTRVSAMFTRWIHSPPAFLLPPAWQNESFWLGLLENYSMARQGSDAILEELESFTDKLGPLMTGDPMRQVALVAQTVMRLVNENLVALQSQNLTLENMFQRVPILQEVFSALGVQGDILDALLKAPVESGEMLMKALLTDGTMAQESVCNVTRLTELLLLPVSFDTTALYQAVCRHNATEAVNNLVRNLNLQDLIDDLESPAAVGNWSQIFQQSEELQRNIQDLISHPPSFNATSLLATLESSFNTTDMWQMATMFDYNSLLAMANMFPELKGLEGVFKSAAVLTEFLDDMVNRLVVDGVTLDLASLFSSSPSFVRLMNAALHAQPDFVTALNSVQLRPSKINEYMALASSDGNQLISALCSPSQFHQYFFLPSGVNISEIQTVLCSLNYTQFVEELDENFMVDALTKKLAAAMNSNQPINIQKYIATYQDLVEHITILAGVQNVTFDGNDLGHVFTINETRLLETLESVGTMLEKEYSALSSVSVEGALAGLTNTSEGQTIVYALKVIEVYLHSFNQVLEEISSGPISLASIVNNTEVGKIVMPLLENPDRLEDLLELELLPQQLNSLLMTADVTDALCGPQLFTAFAAPGNDSAVLRDLQASVCGTNATVMMWQAIMGQANGYQLYQQMQVLYGEVLAGRVSTNTTAISSEVQHLITMVTDIVEEYQNGSRSTEDLLDWRTFEDIFDRFSSSLGARLMNMSQQWSSELASVLMLSLPEDDFSASMARSINTFNIFMNIINNRLDDMLKSGVSLYTLLNHSEALVNLMEAYLDITHLTPQAWLDNTFNISRLVEVSANTTLLDQLCTAQTLSSYLADSSPISTVTTTMQTVMCSISTELPQVFTHFIDFQAIEKQLTTIWNMSVPVEPEYQQYVDNINRLNALITQLATTPPPVDPRLQGQFDFSNILDTLQNIVTKPEMIFRLLKALGLALDGPLVQTNDLENMFYGMNAYVAKPLLSLVQSMDNAGVSLSAVMQDPSKLLEAVPVLMNFHLHFDVMDSAYLQPLINRFWNNEDFRNNHFCNGSLPDDVFTSVGLQPSVVTTLCQIPTTEWVPTLRALNVSAAQMLNWVGRVEDAYNAIPLCYDIWDVSTGAWVAVCQSYNADMFDNRGMYWMRLMTTLESVVTHLVPDNDPTTAASTGESLGRIWDILKDAFFNKTLNSAMNYMETYDLMGRRTEEWLVFKQVMKFLQSAGSLLDSGLHRMTDASGTVSLQNLLPDPQELADLLQNIMGPASVSELLTASVSPDLFYQMVYPDQLVSTACDPVRFSAMFTFPAGTNVSLIQTELCEALNNRSTSVQELIDLFQAGDVLVQLDRLIQRNYSGVANDLDLWQTLYSTVSGLVKTLEQLQGAPLVMTPSSSWLDPVLQQLSNLNQPSATQLDAMCQSYITMFGGTQDFQSQQGELVFMGRVINVVSKALPLITRLDNLTCSMVTEKGLDLGAGVEYLKQHGLLDLFHAVGDVMVNSTQGELRCSQLMGTSSQLTAWANGLWQPQGMLDGDKLEQCVERGTPLFADLMLGMNQLYRVLADMSRILKDDDITTMLHNSGTLGEALDFVLSIVFNQQSVVVEFTDLLQNSSGLQSYLTGAMKLAPEFVNSLLASTINLNATSFLNKSVSEIADILCEPALLGGLIQLPEWSPFNVSAVSSYLCTANVNLTASVFKDAGKSEQLIREMATLLGGDSTGQLVTSVTSDLVDLFSQLQSLSTLMGMLDSGFDTHFLLENADTIDAVLAGGGTLQKIVDSLSSLVGTLKYLLPPENHNIITDIRTFISGLLGLDLIQSRLLGAVSVADLQKDVPAVQQYLVDDLGFSPQAASALLASTYSIRVFLNATELLLTEEPCEGKLEQFILINSSQTLQQEITNKFCDLNTTEVTDFMEVMVPQLDIGELVQKYVQYTGDAFLDSLNMTHSDVQVVFQSLSDGGEALEQVSYILQTNNNTLAPLLDMGEASEEEFDAMVSLQPALCGGSEKVDNQFNLNSKVQGAPSERDLQEEAQLTGEFCKELYRSVKKTEMGSVIWAYVKPIMSGKIVFTPDTPLTRKIVQNANWVFDSLSEVKQVAKKWSEKVPSLVTLTDTASDMANLQSTLNNGFIQGVVQSTLGVDSDSLTRGLDALQSNNMNTSDFKSLQMVAELIYNYTTCLDLDRFEGVDSEAKLEQRALELFGTNNFLGGLVFLDLDKDSGSRKKREADSSNGLPQHIKYKIRMDIDNVPTTNRIKDRLWMPYPRDVFASHLRYMRGFIQLQDMVENAIVKMQADHSGVNYTSTGVLMQQMPFPCRREDDYIHFLGSYLLPILMTFAWLAAIGIATHNLVSDRESGQEESLRIMGMVSGLNFVAWLLVTVVIMAFVAFIITIIFKYASIFHYSNSFLIFLYLLDFCLSTTLMCYFVSSFFSRATVAILTVLIVYFLSYLPYIILVSLEAQMNIWQKSLACLFSTTAFSYGAMFITRFEEETKGLQWDNVDDKLYDSVSFSWMCYMMLIDSAIYLVLGWYIRNIKPGKYGVRQPWYFPVLPSYWCSCISREIEALPPPSHSSTRSLHEPPPDGLDIGISVRGLRKRYSGGQEVVHGVDVDVYHDQITTMLGHNGAAKTTTLNMLVGVLNPSGGVVLVEGKKTFGKTGLLGICPQHNTLFEYMTVQEHMEFYGEIKGRLSGVERKREIRKLLQDVDLLHLKDVPAVELSGGMQRRLCVALAFVGGSKTVVLDEPTSGVDPHARKNIWNLIMQNRPGRTILMSTHHLDEADTISDRLLIMHSGRLLGVGSPAFLKDQLGGGYRLTLDTAPVMELHNELKASPSADLSSEEMSNEHTKVMTFIKSDLPMAEFVESVGTDLTVSLPHYGDKSGALHQFFRHLDDEKADLGVLSYGISNTTLEDVFLKLTTEAESQNSSNGRARSTTISTDTESVSTNNDHTILSPSGGRPKPSVRGASLKRQQLGALLLKRIHHYRRNWRMAVSTLILPLIAFLCAMGFSALRPTEDSMDNLIMTPALYARDAPKSYSFFKDNAGTGESHHFINTLMSTSPGIGTTCMDNFDPGDGFSCVATRGMFESTKKAAVCKCNDFVYECADSNEKEGVMEMMTHTGIMLQDLSVKDIDQYLVTSYDNYIDERFGGWSLELPSVSGNTSTPLAKIWFNNKGYHAIPSYFNAFTNNLLRSVFTPSQAPNYGITLYNHPLMLSEGQLSAKSIETGATDVGISMVILLALSFIPSAFMIYLINEKTSQERHMQSISGVSTVLYWSASFLWDLFVYSIALGIMVVIVVIFKSDGFYDRENLGAFALLVFLYGWAVIPLMYCTLRWFKSGSAAYLTLFCLNMLIGLITTIILFIFTLLPTDDGIEDAAKVLKYVFLIFPQFSLGMGLVELVTNQFQSELLARFGEDTYVSPYDLEMLGWKYVALAAQGVLFMILTFFIHSRKERAIGMSSGMHYNASKDDEDVFNEQERVRAGGDGDALAVKDLCKVYRRGLNRFCAVNHLSFGVGKGECFGLLGVNGAGKTTTFKMLTGATTPSDGDAIIHSKQLSRLRSSLGQQLGYCPQENALDMHLSGEETLTFHAKLQGFDSQQTDRVVAEQLKRLQLEQLADKPVHTYSGGNKRKLNLAVAMMGDPPLLLLDEPTTGMDAATRRLAWKCITTATQRGQSVLLTSHSMDECDALCSRLAIMVNGQLKCIGSPQHLKHKFGEGYTVVLHLQGLSSNRYSIAESFMSHFQGSVIKVSLKMKDHHHSIVEVCIPREAGRVADIFAALLQAQTEHQITYYSVSQTTLDTVFVRFAREQTDDDDHEADMDSSSGGSSRGSTVLKDPNFHKSLTGGTYAYMNPEYSSDPLDSFTSPSAAPPDKVQPVLLSFENKAYDDELFVTKL